MEVTVLSSEPVLQVNMTEAYYKNIFLAINAETQIDIPMSRANLDALYPDWRENVEDEKDVFNSLDLEYLVTICKVIINQQHEYKVTNFDWTTILDKDGEPISLGIDDDFGESPCILTLYTEK